MPHIAIKKTPFGPMPADKATHKLISGMKEGKVLFARVIDSGRTIQQNSTYWMFITDIAKHTGDTKDDMHETFKKHYVLPVLVRDDEDYGEILAKVQGLGTEAYDAFIRRFISTTDLSVKQFAEVLDEIERDATTRGIPIRRPDDRYWESLMEDAA